MQLAKRVWDFSTSHDLLHDGDQVVIGVSGGPDSLCLLDVLHSLASRHQLRLVVAHLNHGLRPEAAAEAVFVQTEAQQRGLGYFSETADVAAMAAADRQSIETKARALRYAFLGRVARQTGARLVAVAHTADDQAETVLMHLLRGAGLKGLRGMLPKRNHGLPITNDPLPLFLIRPLLCITRAEVVTYCTEQHLAPRVDASNADVRYFRNRLRHELLPVLETYNPKVRAGLARTAAAAAGDYELWLEAAQSLWAASLADAPAEPGQVVFDRARWLALTVAQQRALLRLAVENLVAEADEIDFAPLEAAVLFSRAAEPGRTCPLAGGVALRVTVDQIAVFAPSPAPDRRDWPRMVDGALAPGWHLWCEPLGAEGRSRSEIIAAPRWTAYVDGERIVGPIQLRARRPGDRFQPLGLSGHSVLLSDFMVNQKLPASQRDSWPVLVCGEEIVWVVGLRLDERYKVTTHTRQVTRLLVAPDDEDE